MNNTINFCKMTAQGNNYIYLDNRDNSYDNLDFNSLSKDISDIRFGIGSDGLVVINHDNHSDCFMRIFNNDGSEAKMCGNALRCVAYLIAESNHKQDISINTLSGVKLAQVNQSTKIISVNMGTPKLLENYNSPLLPGNVIDIGNQHLIVNNNELKLSREEFLKLAEDKQASPDFPDGINIELIEIVDRKRITAIVYERGSGLTFACGSGASALYWDCYQNNLVDETAIINLDGGELKVSLENNNVILEGSVSYICKGSYNWS